MSALTDSSENLFRIFDANLNRCVEGLRTLEDLARLLFDEKELSSRLKELRHSVVFSVDEEIQKCLLKMRESGKDVGKNITTMYQEEEKTSFGLINSNSRRVEEALRVLEELSNSGIAKSNASFYKETRFEMYSIQKVMADFALRKSKVEKVKGLHVIIDEGILGGRNALQIAEEVLKGGADVIQMRYKKASSRRLLEVANGLKAVCRKYKAIFIVNDHADIAASVEADGIHLGQEDLSIKEARKIIPYGAIIGISCNNKNELKGSYGADYVGAGAIYATGSKDDISTIGIKGIKEVINKTKLPIVAIGGINKDNIGEVLTAGACGAAVISAVLLDKCPEEAVRNIKKEMAKVNG